jgi:hypothetical protein
MSIFDPLKASIAPYLVIIKLAVVAAVFLGGLFTGCQWQESRDDKKIEKAQSAVLYYKGQAEVNASALTEVNKQYKANKQAALEWRQRADDSARAAEKEKRENDKELQKWAEEVDRLKKDPDCKALMEAPLCKAITSF